MPHPVLDEIDVVIIGGGIVGSCLAGFLAEEGLGVAVIDDGRIDTDFVADIPGVTPAANRISPVTIGAKRGKPASAEGSKQLLKIGFGSEPGFPISMAMRAGHFVFTSA
jgi:choline dehydrogenase-like flavoprotein